MAFIPYDSDFDDANSAIDQAKKTESNIMSLLCEVIDELKLLNERFEESFETSIQKDDLP